MTNILVVDDKKSMCNMLKKVFTKQGYSIFISSSGKQALELLSKHKVDILITDLKMPHMDGLELLEKARAISPQTATIVITAYGSVQDAVRAMKSGAIDFVEKPFSIDTIEKKVQYVAQKKPKITSTQRMLGISPCIQEIQILIDKVADASSSVLIIGESGTGKELVAKEIHYRSPRKKKPFIAINCGALVPTLVENELFGHEKGAYTGAQSIKKGRFELAHEGTLLLDEIAEMDYNLQSKLLRVLQEKSFERIGGSQSISIDVRIVAATNKNISKLIEEGSFREDLFYRLNVITIEVPALRQRREDIVQIATYYLNEYSKTKERRMQFSPETLAILQTYHWPGNIRQLKNAIERGVILAEGDLFTPSELPREINSQLDLNVYSKENLGISEQLELIEKETIRQVLEQVEGNQSKAAKKLGLKRSVLQYKIKKYGI